MKRNTKRFSAAAGLLVAALGLAVVGSSTTGAYFSDSKQGNVTGTVGSIKITGSGGNGANGLDEQFNNLLPGEVQTKTVSFANTGTNPEDVWVVFNNPDALHALNDLGTYGEVHITASGTEVFASANLNDNSRNSCGPLSPQGCWPLPQKVKLASNLAPGAGGTFGFGFGYASKLQAQSPAGGGTWNPYPLASPTASGLPYQLVAVQPGQTP